MRPTFIEVSLENLRYNLELIRNHTDNRPLMAVVKSNAYGHGMVRVAKLYEKLGVNCLGVALLEEGIVLRESGITLPIVVFGEVLKKQIPAYLEWNLEFFVSSSGVLRPSPFHDRMHLTLQLPSADGCQCDYGSARDYILNFPD
jgi:alanine racemase